MSSYILGDSWPLRPSWSTYMQKSTYRHDFGQGQTVNFTKPLPRSYYDTAAINRHRYEPRPRGPRDDTRLPLNQGRGFEGHRQEGPYTDRGGYNRFDDYYDGRNRDIRYPNRGDYERRYDPYYNEGHYTDRPGDYERRHDNYYNDGPNTDRPRFDRRDGSLERGYDRRPDDRNGPYTDRGEYNRRGGMNDPYIDKRRDERDMYHNPQPRYEQRMPNDEPQIYDKYANNRTTQQDYGDFQKQPSQRVEKPHAYRGEVDKEIDAFHNKDIDNSAPETPDVPRRRDKDGNYVDDIYLRPEERQVRHRNMEFEYDAQQRLPLNIAPQTDYKSNIQRPARSESGAYLFIRTQKDAMFDIKRSFQRHKSILKMSGHLKGVATPDKISVMGDFTNWHIKSPMIRKGEYWYEQSGGVMNHEYGTDYIILCLWFPSVDTAKLWIHYDVDFKIASFPEPYGVEILILPINYVPMNDIECNTFVMTEYPEIVNKDGLKKYVKDPMEELLVKDSKYERCEPFVVWTDRIVMERGMWVSSRSVMSVHRFRSLNQAREFYNDPRIERVRRELKDITKGGRHTTVMFQLVDFI